MKIARPNVDAPAADNQLAILFSILVERIGRVEVVPESSLVVAVANDNELSITHQLSYCLRESIHPEMLDINSLSASLSSGRLMSSGIRSPGW